MLFRIHASLFGLKSCYSSFAWNHVIPGPGLRGSDPGRLSGLSIQTATLSSSGICKIARACCFAFIPTSLLLQILLFWDPACLREIYPGIYLLVHRFQLIRLSIQTTTRPPAVFVESHVRAVSHSCQSPALNLVLLGSGLLTQSMLRAANEKRKVVRLQQSQGPAFEAICRITNPICIHIGCF